MASQQKEHLIEAHQPHWLSLGLWLVLVALFFLAEAALAWSLYEGRFWLAIILVVLAAHLMHAHLIAFHEAAHGSLCPSRRVNDACGIFISIFALTGLSLYRAVHHTHHAYLATERDEELWPFVIPGMPRWFRRLFAVLELTVALVLTPLMFLRSFLRAGSPVGDPALRRRIWAELALIVAVWGATGVVIAWYGIGKIAALTYVVPAILAANVQSLRKYIEHMGLTGGTVLSSTRSIVPSRSSGHLIAFSLLNICYHGVHHLYARLPYDQLPRFSTLLEPATPNETAPFPGYISALGPMLRSLGDPRIGAQWLRSPTGQPGQRPQWSFRSKAKAV